MVNSQTASHATGSSFLQFDVPDIESNCNWVKEQSKVYWHFAGFEMRRKLRHI
jgi:hypothetical protein